MKVHGHISQLGVNGTLSQLNVRGGISQLGVSSSFEESGVSNTVPVLQSAAIENADPSKIILTYDIALNEAYVPGLNNYTLYETLFYTSIEVSGNTVIINLDPAAEYGDEASISYSPYAIDGVALRSEAGALAASFTSYPVTNNVLQSYPAELANRFFWYDPSDLTTITKDGADIISRVNDKLGNGNDLVAGSALWTANTVLYDGSSQVLASGAIAAMVQPCVISIIIKHITWTANDRWFDGYIYNSARITQAVSSPNIRAYAGLSSGTLSVPLDTWGVLTVIFNGANSWLQWNDGTPVEGNFGAGNPGGIRIGNSLGGGAGNIQHKDFIAMPGTTKNADIYNWLVTRL